MKIQSVKFKSFRQHRAAEFDFSDERGNLVIIKGNNGAGKTTFLNGVTWCLYDLVDGRDNYSRESLVSQSDVLASSPGDEITTEVSVSVLLAGGTKGIVTRRIDFVRVDEGVKVIRSELNVLSQADISVGFANQTEPQDWIDSKLPPRFSPYFLFDGERLDRFFKESDARFIKDSVLQIAQVDILALMIKHLETVSEELTREAAKHVGSEGEALAKEYESVCERLNEMEEKRQAAIANVNSASDSVNEAQGRLGEIAVIAQLVEQRKQLTSMHKDAIERVQSCEDELASWAYQSGPSVLLRESLEVLRERIDSARREQVLPPPFDPQALIALLKGSECICGRDLKNDSDARSHIEHIISKYEVISEVGDALSRLEGPMMSSLTLVSRGAESSARILDRLKKAREEASKLGTKLDQLNLQLSGHNDAEVALLHDQLRKAESSRNTAIENRGRFSAEIDALKERQGVIEKKISSQKSQSIKAEESLRKSAFARQTLELSRQVYENLSDGVRNDVARNLDQQFKNMIWKKDFVNEVGIDDDFRVSVVNNRGFEILGELSAGERICLAFAYSLTLATVAGVRFPLVVDSPMGKLGPEVQDNLSQVLASETAIKTDDEDQQLILLMTGTEYTKSVQRIFAKRDPLVYSIEFDVAVSETNVVKESV